MVTGAGATNGIGFAIAHALALLGHSVAITATSDRVHDRARELVELSLNVRSIVADLTDAKDVARLYQEVGALNVLINNAGLGSLRSASIQKRFVDLDEREWDQGIGVNLETACSCS